MKLNARSKDIHHGRIVGALLLSVSTSVNLVRAQSVPSPNEVVQAYRKLDAEGLRLTASGWYNATKFFVKPERPPQRYVLGVMFGEAIYNTRVDGIRAEVLLTRSALGQIDSSGRFTSVVAPYLLGSQGRSPKQGDSPTIHGLTRIDAVYQLILTDTHWEFGPAGEGPQEIKGSPEWRLEYFEYEPWVTKDVAIRYLIKLRDESSSDIIRENASKSIAILRRVN